MPCLVKSPAAGVHKKLPRQYIQLHRDTTVSQLTVQPGVLDGIISYRDSPLVEAVQKGYVLVIDEADKAPTHVTAILKGLAEDREMLLADGRRIKGGNAMKDDGDRRIIRMHQNFRIIMLANRPGFPFLGNDFYKIIGSAFCAFAVDNADADSELEMLRKYGRNVPEKVLQQLVQFVVEVDMLDDILEAIVQLSKR